MKTEYTVFRPDGSSERGEIDWPAQPGYRLIKALVEPLLGENEPLEHVSVLWQDRPTDMFASELGQLVLTTRAPLPRNDQATEIYRAYSMSRTPVQDPESLPTIAGTAVLFHRRVWF